MCDVRMENKIALYVDGKKITKYVYDWGEMRNSIVCMGINQSRMDVYHSKNGNLKFSIKGVRGVNIEKGVIIVTMSCGKFGVYDFDGNVILPAIYSKIYSKEHYYIAEDFDNHITLYKKDENNNMTIIIPSDKKFIECRLYEEGIITYKETDSNETLCGVYSYSGEELVPAMYKKVTFKSDGIFVKTIEDKEGIYSYSGKQIVPVEYSKIKKYHNCYVVTTCKNLAIHYGLYTQDGKQVLPPRYDRYIVSGSFVSFYIHVNGCLYNLDDGKRILPLNYKDIHIYYNIVVATEDWKRYSIYSAESGKRLSDSLYDNVEIYAPNVLLLENKYRNDFFYLIEYNTFVNANTHDIKYNDEDRKLYIRKRFESSDWQLYVKP